MWKEWFPEYKIPKTIDRLVAGGILQDKTNNRDWTPHFEAILPTGTMVLWVDHQSVGSRFYPDGPRYVVNFHIGEQEGQTLLETNSLDEVLFFIEYMLAGGRGLRLI